MIIGRKKLGRPLGNCLCQRLSSFDLIAHVASCWKLATTKKTVGNHSANLFTPFTFHRYKNSKCFGFAGTENSTVLIMSCKTGSAHVLQRSSSPSNVQFVALKMLWILRARVSSIAVWCLIMDVKVNDQSANITNRFRWFVTIIYFLFPSHPCAGQYHVDIGQLELKPECKNLPIETKQKNNKANTVSLGHSCSDKSHLSLYPFTSLFAVDFSCPFPDVSYSPGGTVSKQSAALFLLLLN